MVLILVVLRILIPGMVLRYANKTLAELDGYYGQVEDINIALYRGAYQLDGFYLNKVDSAAPAGESVRDYEWEHSLSG